MVMPGGGVDVATADPRAEEPPQVTINPTVVKKLLQLHWSKDSAADGAKINPDAAVLVAEYLRLFVVEAHNRAMLEAELDGDEAMEPHHVERVMLGMLLDF
eukprot:g6637.t1